MGYFELIQAIFHWIPLYPRIVPPRRLFFPVLEIFLFQFVAVKTIKSQDPRLSQNGRILLYSESCT